MTRMDELALAAAATFEDCSDPFSTAWLVEHSVTADECYELSQRISMALRAFQERVTKQRAAVLLREAAGRIEGELLR